MLWEKYVVLVKYAGVCVWGGVEVVKVSWKMSLELSIDGGR